MPEGSMPVFGQPRQNGTHRSGICPRRSTALRRTETTAAGLIYIVKELLGEGMSDYKSL